MQMHFHLKKISKIQEQKLPNHVKNTE